MATQRQKKLGRGLSSLIEDTNDIDSALASSDAASALREVSLDDIYPNTFQPRQRFDDRKLAELAASIRQAGVMQPVVVRAAAKGGYELVAGERRWRAARMAGLSTIPAIVRELDDSAAAELALIENLQRADLNAIERASAFRALIVKFELTQAQVAERVGLDRSSVSNLLRLLELPADLQRLVADGSLSSGHAKVLVSVEDDARRRRVSVEDDARRRRLAERIIAEQLSVRQAEAALRELSKRREPEGGGAQSGQSANIEDLERRLGEHLRTRVRIVANAGATKGRLVISFYGVDHFDGLLKQMGFGDD